MALCMHAGHFKPQGVFKAVKYSPYNVAAQYLCCNKFLHGNRHLFHRARKTIRIRNLQTLERQSKLYFDYTIPLWCEPRSGTQDVFPDNDEMSKPAVGRPSGCYWPLHEACLRAS